MNIPGFEIDRLIAEGGSSSVYSAVQKSLRRRVALKVLTEFDNAEQSRRFLHEGHIIASLDHRNIITIYDIGRVDNIHYIAMEYLEGGSLADKIAQGMRVPAILDLLETIGRCLDVVHSKGIVHRDIKPGNILFHADHTPKLTDFGIAKELDSDQNETVVGGIIGTPSYLSPEQAYGRPLDGRSDIYSLGIVLYEMLTGKKPYRESTHAETIVAHLRQPIPLLPPQDSYFQDLLQHMIAKEPEGRFATAGELASYVGGLRVAEQALVAAMPVPSGTRHRQPEDREDSGSAVGQLVEEPSSRNGLAHKSTRWAAKALSLLHRMPWKAKSALAMVLAATVVAGFLQRLEPEMPPKHAPPRTDERDVPTAAGSEGISYDPTSESNVREAVTSQERKPSATEGQTALDFAPVPTASNPQHLDEDMASSEPPYALERPSQSSAEVEGSPVPSSENNGPTDTPPSEVAEDPAVQQLLAAGEAALADYRLVTPGDDSALYYYRKLLELEPDHAGALQGIVRIADQYESLARNAIGERKYRTARLYIQRGLSVQPDHSGLKNLKRRTARRSRPNEPRRPSGSTPAEPGGYFLEDF